VLQAELLLRAAERTGLQAVQVLLRVLPQRVRELPQVQVQRVLQVQVLRERQELQELRELLQQVRVLLRVLVQRVLPGELHSQI
jgi:hypothetical protein